MTQVYTDDKVIEIVDKVRDIVSIDRLDFSGNLNRFNHMFNEYDEATKSRLKIIYHDLKSEVNNYSHGIAMHGDLKYKENPRDKSVFGLTFLASGATQDRA